MHLIRLGLRHRFRYWSHHHHPLPLQEGPEEEVVGDLAGRAHLLDEDVAELSTDRDSEDEEAEAARWRKRRRQKRRREARILIVESMSPSPWLVRLAMKSTRW